MEQLWFDKYCPLDLLGSNNDVESYLALHVKLDEKRFVKRVYKGSPYYTKFIKEAEILKSLNNGHVPKVYDIEEDENYYYIIEQYIDGISLKDFCEKQKELSFAKIAELSFEICEILDSIHKSVPTVLHLDLGAENILISDAGLFLVDFGNALVKPEGPGKSVMYEKYFFGTKGFSAPEQRMGIVDERTDIYALGKLIEYLQKYQVERAKADGLLKGILRRCCEELPDRRFKTAEEVKTELEKLLKDVARERLEGGKFVENSKKTITVGVVGAFRGAGTTHTAIMLAGYFRKKTKGKVAIAEASGRTDIGSMKAYGAEFEEGFKIKGISFFEVGTERDIVKLYNNDFSYLVLDMGTIEEGIQEEFLRCDYKVVVTGNALWRDRYNEVLYKALKAHGNSRWIVLNNLETALKRRDLYSKEIKQAAIGFCEDIFNISEKTQKHLKALFN